MFQRFIVSLFHYFIVCLFQSDIIASNSNSFDSELYLAQQMATLAASRQKASLKEGIEDDLNNLDLGFCKVRWIRDDDPIKQYLFALANAACLLPIVFILMFMTLILQVLGKSTFLYPGYDLGERIGANVGLFGGNGIGKSLIDAWSTEVVDLFYLLVKKKCSIHGVTLDPKLYKIWIHGSRAKKLMQEVEKNDGSGVALYAEGGVCSKKLSLHMK